MPDGIPLDRSAIPSAARDKKQCDISQVVSLSPPRPRTRLEGFFQTLWGSYQRLNDFYQYYQLLCKRLLLIGTLYSAANLHT
jgi:hypothetical protein